MLRAGFAVLSLAFALLASLGPGCAPRTPKPVSPDLSGFETPDVPPALRNTISAMATIYGADPVLISGFGIAVNTTGGGGLLRPEIQATMERELAARGMTPGGRQFAGTVFEDLSPRQFLSRNDTAVVVAWAVIPPGAPADFKFDVYVEALPNSGVESLEGATLWTTEMRIGLPSVLGGIRAQQVAVARGQLFVNVFPDAETGSAETPRTQGRVLGGGKVTDPLELALALNTESHARARSAQTSINTRFPARAGQRVQTARGKGRSGDGNVQVIAVQIPPTWVDEPGAFLQVLRHLQVERSFDVEGAAFGYVEAVKRDPYLWEEIAWALEAIGPGALPAIRTLYEYPEILPRSAALRAGARLEDPLVVDHLIEQATSSTNTPAEVVEAVELLGRLELSSAAIDFALRALLADPRLTVRVAAFESLLKRGASSDIRRQVYVVEGPTTAEQRLKAIFDVVPVGEPLVYVKQQGAPHIVLFGEAPRIGGAPIVQALPVIDELAGAGPAYRLLIVGDDDDGPLRVSFRSRRGGRQVLADSVSRDVAEFIDFMARNPTIRDPRPGLDLPYSDIVSVLARMAEEGALGAPLRVEQDRLFAQIVDAARTTKTPDRPEFAGDGPDVEQTTGTTRVTRAITGASGEPQQTRSLLVPIEPRKP
ncbi:MAG: flagellar basal body P-ring protein FlgI [Phycisphaerales bacterium JB039]